MADETTERGRHRWLTGGSRYVRLYAVLLIVGCLALFFGPLGFEDIRLIWIPTAAAILLAIPLYFLLRAGDSRINRAWERRTSGTRLVLRRVGWAAAAVLTAGGGVFLIAVEGDTMGTLAGVALLLWAACLARRAVTESRPGV